MLVICEMIGADVIEVVYVVGTDIRIGNKFLKVSVGEYYYFKYIYVSSIIYRWEISF